MHDFWKKYQAHDYLKSLHHQADEYRLLQLAHNNPSSSLSIFRQNIRAFLMRWVPFRRTRAKTTKGVKPM